MMRSMTIAFGWSALLMAAVNGKPADSDKGGCKATNCGDCTGDGCMWQFDKCRKSCSKSSNYPCILEAELCDAMEDAKKGNVSEMKCPGKKTCTSCAAIGCAWDQESEQCSSVCPEGGDCILNADKSKCPATDKPEKDDKKANEDEEIPEDESQEELADDLDEDELLDTPEPLPSDAFTVDMASLPLETAAAAADEPVSFPGTEDSGLDFGGPLAEATQEALADDFDSLDALSEQDMLDDAFSEDAAFDTGAGFSVPDLDTADTSNVDFGSSDFSTSTGDDCSVRTSCEDCTGGSCQWDSFMNTCQAACSNQDLSCIKPGDICPAAESGTDNFGLDVAGDAQNDLWNTSELPEADTSLSADDDLWNAGSVSGADDQSDWSFADGFDFGSGTNGADVAAVDTTVGGGDVSQDVPDLWA